MQRKRNRILVFVLSIILLLCTGCYDAKEIDETAYIIALGIDKFEDEEYKYTFQFSAPLAIAGVGAEKQSNTENKGGGIEDSGNPSVNNVVIKAPDFYIAKNMINNFFSKNIDMSHLKLIVFSKEIDADKLIHHSQLFLREREVRPHTSLAVSEKSAEEFIRSVNPELEANTAKYYELMSLRSNNIYAPSKRLRDFVEETKNGGGSVLPVAHVTGYDSSEDFGKSESKKTAWVKSKDTRVSSSRADMRGMAVFADRKLKKIMDGDSALIFNVLERDVKNFIMSIRNAYNPDETLSFRILIPQKTRYDVKKGGKGYEVKSSTILDAEYIGGEIPEGYKSYDELYEELEKTIAEEFSLFFQMLVEEGADIVGIEKNHKKNFSTLKDVEELKQEKFFDNVKMIVDIKII